jgi:hypothetical protein
MVRVLAGSRLLPMSFGAVSMAEIGEMYWQMSPPVQQMVSG